MKNRYLIQLLVFVLLSFNVAYGQETVCAGVWNIRKSNVKYTITKNDDDELPFKLEFYSPKGEKLKEYSIPTLGFIGAFVTEREDGRLITIWTSATGYIVLVYFEKNGQLVKVLDSGSKMMPEIIFTQINNKYNEVLVFTEYGWHKKNGQNILGPFGAVQYTWKNNKYNKAQINNWNKRFIVQGTP